MSKPMHSSSARQPDDDIELRNYQDTLDTDDLMHDPVMDEKNDDDDPTAILGIPRAEFAQELDKQDIGGNEPEDEDMREAIEDHDQDSDDRQS